LGPVQPAKSSSDLEESMAAASVSARAGQNPNFAITPYNKQFANLPTCQLAFFYPPTLAKMKI
jgi:hypothetical protein